MPLLSILRGSKPAKDPDPPIAATPYLLPKLRVRLWLYTGQDTNSYDATEWQMHDVSTRTSSLTITRGRSSTGNASADPGSINAEFDNSDGFCDNNNTKSPISSSSFRPGIRFPPVLTVEHEFEGSFRALGTGLLEDIQRSWGPAGRFSISSAQFVDYTSRLATMVPAAGHVLLARQAGQRISQLRGLPTRTNEKFAHYTPIDSRLPSLSTGSRLLGQTVTDGRTSLWDYMREAAFAEGGLIFFGPTGRLTFHDEQYRRSRQLASAAFGDAAGETEVTPSLTFRQSSTGRTQEVAYTTVDGAWTASASRVMSGVSPLLSDANGTYELATGTYIAPDSSGTVTALGDVAQVAARARYDFRRSLLPPGTAETVTLDVLAAINDRALFSPYRIALGLELSDRVTLRRRPSSLESAQVADYFVEQITHTIQAGREWKTTLRLESAAGLHSKAWVLGFDSLGKSTQLTW